MRRDEKDVDVVVLVGSVGIWVSVRGFIGEGSGFVYGFDDLVVI